MAEDFAGKRLLVRLTRKNRHKDYLMISDRSGFRYPANEIVRQWDGSLVARREEEPRHPQEFVRGVVDDYAVRNPRPRFLVDGVIGTGSATSARTVTERDGDNVVTRAADQIGLREATYTSGETLLVVDLGSIQQISAIEFTIDTLTEGRDSINFYTSEDNVSYNAMTTPFVEQIRGFEDGVSRRVSIGRFARYVQIRFEIFGTESVTPTVLISQFDIIGSEVNS